MAVPYSKNSQILHPKPTARGRGGDRADLGACDKAKLGAGKQQVWLGAGSAAQAAGVARRLLGLLSGCRVGKEKGEQNTRAEEERKKKRKRKEKEVNRSLSKFSFF
ncbi:hypothetical protein SLA2020_076870 [Shorea laevis]